MTLKSRALIVMGIAAAAGCAGTAPEAPTTTSAADPGARGIAAGEGARAMGYRGGSRWQGEMPSGPYVVVLGTAQDAGIPQIGSDSPGSVRARRDPAVKRLVTSLLVVDPATGERWLFDCSPDIREQVEMARRHPRTNRRPGPRPPLFDGVFLTHAHMGHYTGLLHFGREAYAAKQMPVYGSASMVELLRTNAPWELLVRLDQILPQPLELDTPMRVSPSVTITAMQVPHRGEYTDTLAFVIRGPSRSLLYLPDIDKWERWDRAIEDVVAEVDIAMIDGTFFGEGEIPGRSMAEIPHPFISESLQRFRSLPAKEREKIVFTHLNHSNPAADSASDAATAILGQEMTVAREGAIFSL